MKYNGAFKEKDYSKKEKEIKENNGRNSKSKSL